MYHFFLLFFFLCTNDGLDRMRKMGFDKGARAVGLARPGINGKSAYMVCTRHEGCTRTARLMLRKKAGGQFLLSLDGANECECHSSEEL